MKRFEEIPHTADLAARIYGKTLPRLFENAAYAMFSLMCSLKGLKVNKTVNIKVKAKDQEGLLISWLNELLYKSFSNQVIFSKFKISSLGENRLAAEAKGHKMEKENWRQCTEIKAATYHDLEIEKKASGYETTIVFDV